MRHDWNSLLHADPSVEPVTNRTTARWPHADVLLSYLRDYAAAQDAAGRISYNSTVVSVSPVVRTEGEDACLARRRRFVMGIQRSVGEPTVAAGTSLTVGCGVIVMATGLGDPNVPLATVDGVEHATLYRDLPSTGESFQGQTVAVLGGGNAAFETTDALAPFVAYVHLWKGRRGRVTPEPSSFVSWES